MTDDSPRFELGRRKALATIGGLAIAGAGLGAVGSAGASSTANITSANVSLTNDRGDLSSLTIDPSFSVSWSGLDDAVGKVFYLVEAKVGSEGTWAPIFRATPWLEAAQIGTTGSYGVERLTTALNADDRFDDGDGPDYSANPLVVADEQGKPDYSSLSFPGGVDLQSFLDGTSIGGAGDYPGAHEDGGHQNNYWDIDAGYYGAAADTSTLDNPDGGTSKATTISVRYTFELQRPNLSQLKYRVDFGNYDGPETGATSFSELSVAEQKRFAADQIDGLEESDIDDGNSTIVMNGEDGNYGFETPSGISYADMQAHPDHAGIVVEETSFEATVTNEVGTSSASGDTGGDAN